MLSQRYAPDEAQAIVITVYLAGNIIQNFGLSADSTWAVWHASWSWQNNLPESLPFVWLKYFRSGTTHPNFSAFHTLPVYGSVLPSYTIKHAPSSLTSAASTAGNAHDSSAV